MPHEIDQDFVNEVGKRLSRNQPIRRTLAKGGRLHVDRQVPFLCVHRMDAGDADTRQFVAGEASYLVTIADLDREPELLRLIARLGKEMCRAFGTFLVIEVWTGSDGIPRKKKKDVPAPTFRVHSGTLPPTDPTVRELRKSLATIPLRPPPLDVEIVAGSTAGPPSLSPLLPPDASPDLWHWIGIEVEPVYRQARTGLPYPVLFETLRRGLSRALKQTAYHFADRHTVLEVPHYHALGRRTVVRAAKEADTELTTIARSFDFLLQVTPVNAARARADFLQSGCEEEPVFDYRPLAVDVGALKRRLYNLPIEKMEDPTLSHLLADARDMLGRRAMMLGDRNTPRFLYGGLGVYGAVEDELDALARELLRRSSTMEGGGEDEEEEEEEEGGPEAPAHLGVRVNAADFATMAEKELERYREVHRDLDSRVEVRDDIAGMLVTKGNLMVGSRLNVSMARAKALLQHEVGTHVVTYSNGLAQPLELLAIGLARYEETQEGLAVLAEYLAGGLTVSRFRILAARVLVVRCMTGGASFVEAHRMLVREHGFRPFSAFTVCMRVYRSGGFPKDAIYLRGLVKLLEYLGRGGDLEPLLVGKVALSDIPSIEELRWRKYLAAPRLTPRYLTLDGARERLASLREGRTVVDLLAAASP